MEPLILPTPEEVLSLIRYRLPDPRADAELEISDYRREVEASAPISSSQSYDDVLGFMTTHLRLPHVLERTRTLVAVAQQIGARTYADWGAGGGRECIAMSRAGLDVTHLDLIGERAIGENTALAQWRYAQRGLSVRICDALDPPADAFDIISNFDVLEHVDDPIAILGQNVSHLNPGGVLFLVGDFYSFDLADASKDFDSAHAGVHLPKNFVYGGITHIALERVGMRKICGGPTPWVETASSMLTIWQKPETLDVRDPLPIALREEARHLLGLFRGFYDRELARLDR